MTSPIITEAVRALVDRRDLTRIEAAAAMEAIMSGAATNAQIAAFLTALRMKGETVEELIGFAQVMRREGRAGAASARAEVVGAHRHRTARCSSTPAAPAATPPAPSTSRRPPRSWWPAPACRVAKHGNRDRCSSLCGSADVVETLGINLELSPAQVARCVDEVGIGFLVRAAPAHGDEARHGGAARDGHPHRRSTCWGR